MVLSPTGRRRTGGGGRLPERLLGRAATHQAEDTGRQADAPLRPSGPGGARQPRQPPPRHQVPLDFSVFTQHGELWRDVLALVRLSSLQGYDAVAGVHRPSPGGRDG